MKTPRMPKDRSCLSGTKRILARDERILEAHQGVRDEVKTDLFREYQQEIMTI